MAELKYVVKTANGTELSFKTEAEANSYIINHAKDEEFQALVVREVRLPFQDYDGSIYVVRLNSEKDYETLSNYFAYDWYTEKAPATYPCVKLLYACSSWAELYDDMLIETLNDLLTAARELSTAIRENHDIIA